MKIIVNILSQEEVNVYKAKQREDKTYSPSIDPSNLLITDSLTSIEKIIDDIPVIDCCYIDDKLVNYRKGNKLVKKDIIYIYKHQDTKYPLSFLSSLNNKGVKVIENTLKKIQGKTMKQEIK